MAFSLMLSLSTSVNANAIAGGGYSSSYSGESVFTNLGAGASGQFSAIFFNDGTTRSDPRIYERTRKIEKLIKLAPTILSIGRLVPQKGFDQLLAAFSGLVGRFPEWRLVILGEGPMRSNLEEMCDNLGLKGQVTFSGTITITEHLLRCAKIFVLPSRYEGFPNALLEAMAAGMAVVSFDCPTGPREMIEPGTNGVLVPLGKISLLESSLAELMSDPQKRARLGDRARLVRELYSLAEISRQWMQVLDDQIEH